MDGESKDDKIESKKGIKEGRKQEIGRNGRTECIYQRFLNCKARPSWGRRKLFV
jgi:hypothetical protein